MKKKIAIISVFSLAVFSFFGALPASAASTDWADTVVDFTQGTQKGGDPVLPARSDPNNALGAVDGAYVSLGYAGEIVLGFPVKGVGTLSVAAHEITTGPYPVELADVYVSPDGINWTPIGTASNEGGTEDGITELPVGADICVQYVKLVDATDGALHGDESDGYDVDAISFTYDEECQEPEEPEGGSDGNDTVVNENIAKVVNIIGATANTGGNWAGGSYGGEGGEGGDIKNGSEGDVEGSTAGGGGAGGDANAGGTVITGNASTTLRLLNQVNYNDTEIDRCACGDDSDGDIRVRNTNRAFLMNAGTADANTGLNLADGSYGGEGGEGGDIYNSGEGDVEDSTTGLGGDGGAGGLGGLIQTGRADTFVDVVNTINRNITRIRR